MKPGPELDQEIAEKIMGWKLVDRYNEESCETEKVWQSAEKSDSFEAWADSWSPSKFIICAWRVVDKLREHNLFLKLEEDIYLPGGHLPGSSRKYGAAFRDKTQETQNRYEDYDYPDATSESAPHAICLAALEAYRLHKAIFAKKALEQFQAKAQELDDVCVDATWDIELLSDQELNKE